MFTLYRALDKALIDNMYYALMQTYYFIAMFTLELWIKLQ